MKIIFCYCRDFEEAVSPEIVVTRFKHILLQAVKSLFGIVSIHRALTRILKTGVQDSHLAKSRSPTGKSGSPTPKSWSPINLCIPYIFSILAGSDTFE